MAPAWLSRRPWAGPEPFQESFTAVPAWSGLNSQVSSCAGAAAKGGANKKRERSFKSSGTDSSSTSDSSAASPRVSSQRTVAPGSKVPSALSR